MKFMIWFVAVLLMAASVAALGLGFNDSCYQSTEGVTLYFGVIPDTFSNFGIRNVCLSGQNTSVTWNEPVNLSILGNVADGDVVIANTFVFVDALARPDLDKPAVLRFHNVPYAVEPKVLRNNLVCNDCNVSYDAGTRTVIVAVSGFSNYSLTNRQDFVVMDDPQPELADKVYQTVDLGDARRTEQFACLVQIYGVSSELPNEWVLAQTNPQRQVQARLFGSPDLNQPESLGYFPTVNGVANVYFDGGKLSGYEDLERVIICSSNSTQLINEQAVSTRYSPVGRGMTGRLVWFTSGSNALYLIIGFIAVVIGIILVVNLAKKVFG